MKEMKADWFLVSKGTNDCIWACHACANQCTKIDVYKPKKCYRQEELDQQQNQKR